MPTAHTCDNLPLNDHTLPRQAVHIGTCIVGNLVRVTFKNAEGDTMYALLDKDDGSIFAASLNASLDELE